MVNPSPTIKSWRGIYLRHFSPESRLLLSELLSTERVRVPLGSHAKAELLRELVQLAVPEAEPQAFAGIVAAVEDRESQVSTALGGGLAVPHGRTNLVGELRMSAGLVRQMRDYDAPDGLPIDVVFLVVIPDAATGQHVKVLSRIARLMHGSASRAALVGAHDAAEFVRVLRRSEAA